MCWNQPSSEQAERHRSWKGRRCSTLQSCPVRSFKLEWFCRTWIWPQHVPYIFFTNGLELEDVQSGSFALNYKIFHVNSTSFCPFRENKERGNSVHETLKDFLGESDYNREPKYTVFYVNMMFWSLNMSKKLLHCFPVNILSMESFQVYKLSKALKKLKVQCSFRWECVSESTYNRLLVFLQVNWTLYKGRLSWLHSKTSSYTGWPYSSLNDSSPLFSTSSLT